MSIFQILAILWARRDIAIAVVAGTLIAAFAILSVLPKRYEATAQMVLNVSSPDIVSNVSIAPGLLRDAVQTHIETIRSRGVASKAAEILGLDKNPAIIDAFNEATGGAGDIREWLADGLLSRITVARLGASQIVSVTARASTAEEAARIANAFVEAHKRKDIEMRVEPAADTLRWFDEQVQTLQRTLAAAQQRRIELRRAGDGSANGPRFLGEDASAFSKDIAAAQLEVAQARAAVDQARAAGTTPTETPDVAAARRQLREIDQQIAQDIGTLGPEHRRIRLLRSNRTVAEKALATALEQAGKTNLVEAEQRLLIATRRLESLNNTVDAALTQSDSRTGLVAADREIQAIETQVSALMQRRERVRLDSELDRTAIAVLARALPAGAPAFPKPSLTLALAGGLGLVLALVVALLVEMLDRRIHVAEDVRAYVDAPLLGTVPKARNAKDWPALQTQSPGRGAATPDPRQRLLAS